MGFDPEKCLCCTVEGRQTLVHGPGGRGYGLGNTAITSGCYQWKFLIVKENKGNEGTCVGVARFPIKDYSHRTTTDMWLYRAYSVADMDIHRSGNLYHNGELALCLPSFTQGDYITVVLDLDARTVSFGKNGEEPRLAFEDVDAAELYPCVMFYSTNPGEKVKMTDMQVRGTPRDMLPGDPHCAPLPAVMSEAYIYLLRKLSTTDIWARQVSDCLVERLNQTKELLPPPAPESTITSTQSSAGHHNVNFLPNSKDDSQENKQKVINEKAESSEDDKKQSESKHKAEKKADWLKEINLEQLCKEVWPALAVIGGVDRGLRVGGQCIHKPSGRKAVVLGTLKQGLASVKVQWDDAEASISDGLLSTLEPCEQLPMNTSKLTNLTPDIFLQIARLSGLTDEFEFPSCDLTTAEMELVNAEPVAQDMRRRHSSVSTDSWRHESTDVSKVMAARTVESLTNEMVSSIIGENYNIGVEKTRVNQERLDSKVKRVQNTILNCTKIEVRVANHKLLECEVVCLQLSFLQLAALKTFATLVSCGRYAELLLVPNTVVNKPELGKDKVYGEEKCTAVQTSLAREFRRIGTCGDSAALYDAVVGPCSPHNSALHAPSPSSLSRLVRRISPLVPPSSLPLAAALCSFSEFSSPQLTSPSLSNKSTPQSAPLLRVHRLRTPSPPPPAIAAPLMEMGFSLKHVQKAMIATGSTGDMSATTINTLATWMIEHPCIDSEVLEGRDDDSARTGTSEIMLSCSQTVEMSQCSPELDMGSARRSGIGPRRRACSDIRNYLAERAAQDRERQHVRGEAQPLYGLSQDVETASDSTVRSADITSGVFPTAATQMDYGLPLICGICHQVSSHLAGHMLSAHPGCGLLWGAGYCGNILGTNYLMCNECQDKYTQCRTKDSTILLTKRQYSIFDTQIAEVDMLCMQTNKQTLPQSDSFCKLAPYLLLKEPDPLGASTVPNVTQEPVSAQPDGRQKSLGEQASLLTSSQDRIMALQRITAAAQILVARSVVMSALSLLSFMRGTSCSLPAGLSAIGLSDIRKVVRLMSLTAGGRVELTTDQQQPLSERGPRQGCGAPSLQLTHLTNHLPPATATCLNYLSCAIAALAQTDAEASELVLQMCTKELMAAAMGAMNQSPNNRIGPCEITPGFAVTQALVALLASHGGTSLTNGVKEKWTGDWFLHHDN
ncbi:hypothetical protein L9F63_011784, partial [Diploptera punctata]